MWETPTRAAGRERLPGKTCPEALWTSASLLSVFTSSAVVVEQIARCAAEYFLLFHLPCCRRSTTTVHRCPHSPVALTKVLQHRRRLCNTQESGPEVVPADRSLSWRTRCTSVYEFAGFVLVYHLCRSSGYLIEGNIKLPHDIRPAIGVSRPGLLQNCSRLRVQHDPRVLFSPIGRCS